MQNILIVEDDSSLAVGLCRALHTTDTDTESCDTLAEARRRLAQKEYDLVLLDVNLPDGDGFSLLEELKTRSVCAVIMLTANDLESDIVSGLEQGADDYVTKPFSLAVLRARVAKQLEHIADKKSRTSVTEYQTEQAEKQTEQAENEKEQKERTERATASGAENRMGNAAATKFVCDDYIFDFDMMEFYRGEERIELSRTEQKLLRLLTANAGTTLTRDTLLDRIWTDGAAFVEENALSVTVKRLRDKLLAGDYIKTIYGVGYTWIKKSS